MTRAGEMPEPAPGGEALAPLRGLLELSRLTRRHPTLDETMHALAPIASLAMRYATTVVNMYRPERDEYEVVAVHGSERARQALMGQISPAATWAPLLDARFDHRGVYFIPEGSIEYDENLRWYTPDPPDGPLDERSWHIDDSLFATLDGAVGRRYGIISFDDPISGLRPTTADLEVLGALAANAALAIESSIQVGELHSALSRNRAVIDSALDSVIAVDRDDQVVEFNPAAERLFGYRPQEVIGRRAADLLVPPEGRDDYRQVARRMWEEDGSGLLNRRLETVAMRRDGATFPAELTVTRVEAVAGKPTMFYGWVRDISERRRGEEQLAFLAYHDALTGLPNRIMVEQQLDLALARARRTGGAVALMFVDLDDFKAVNDRLGHAAGDRLLRSVASRLRTALRDTDILARQGGDEFLVLLADLGDEAAMAAESVGAKLLDALREPFVVVGTEVLTGASLGISLYPADAADTEALMRHADSAMYEAKAAGGGRLVFHQGSETLGSRRASISHQLHAAIAAGEIELHYQPVWRLMEPRRISGVEAVVRWRHPERGLLLPEEFMGLAEQTTVGDELMEWTIAACCRQAEAWAREGIMPLVGINVSPHQLVTPGFAPRFAEQITTCESPPGRFVIELTESAWTVDSAEALAVIDHLHAAGVFLTLDDFGAGYTSLSRLLDLGFDYIKVDHRMLVDVPENPTAVRVLLAAIDLANACGSGIVVDGVGSDAQLDLLIAHGVRLAQGDHLTPPMPASELTPLLRHSGDPGPLSRDPGVTPPVR